MNMLTPVYILETNTYIFKETVMLVSQQDNIHTAVRRVVFGKKGNHYFAWADATTIEAATKITNPIRWLYAWHESEAKKLEFPYSISHEQAQTIINAACSDWRTLLADMWSKSIVLKCKISVEEEFYKKMIKACDEVQKRLLDQIFVLK